MADGSHLPIRDGCADLLCFGQSWHWLDPAVRAHAAARVLRPGGRWAGWWSHARADGEPWFDAYFDLIEAAVPGVRRDRRDIDWGADLRASNLFDVRDCVRFPWEREVDVETWLLDDRSRSYIAGLPTDERERLIGAIRGLIEERFPDSHMTVAYETWLWVGTVR